MPDNSQFSILNSLHPSLMELQISDFEFRIFRPAGGTPAPWGFALWATPSHKQVIIACHGVAHSAKPDGAAVPAAHAGETPALQRQTNPGCLVAQPSRLHARGTRALHGWRARVGRGRGHEHGRGRGCCSGYWMVIGGIQTTPGVSMVPVSSHFSTNSNRARRAASSPARFLAN